MSSVANTEMFAVGRVKRNYYRNFELLSKCFLTRVATITLGWLYFLVSGKEFDLETSRDLAKLFVNREKMTHVEGALERVRALPPGTCMRALFFHGGVTPSIYDVPKESIIPLAEENLASLHQQDVEVLAGMIKRKAKIELVQRTVAKRWDTFSLAEKVRFISLFHSVGRYDFVINYLAGQRTYTEAIGHHVRSGVIQSFVETLFVLTCSDGYVENRSVDEIVEIMSGITANLPGSELEGITNRNTLWSALLDYSEGDLRRKLGHAVLKKIY